MSATHTDIPTKDAALVLSWRLEELERAGWPANDAALLAGNFQVDLHLAISLLRHGCPAETALRILL